MTHTMLRRAASVAAARVSASVVRQHQRIPRRGLVDLNPPPKPFPNATSTSASAKVAAVLPGLGLAFGVAQCGFVFADKISTRTGVSVSGVPLAILAGAALNNLPNYRVVNSTLCTPGVSFAKSGLLKLGIACVGLKLSAADVASVGLCSIPIVLTSVTVGLVVVPLLAKRAGLTPKLGQLLAVGTGVCGVTAISALAPVIGATSAEVSIAVANVAAFGTIGMLLLPTVAHTLLGDVPQAAGALLGTGIHDTAQVFGAALTYRNAYNDDAAFEVAAVTKLTRNLSLAIAIPWLAAGVTNAGSSHSIGTANTGGGASQALVRKAIPSFLVFFLLASVARGAGDAYFGSKNLETHLAWQRAVHLVGTEFGAKQCLGTAMAGVGLSLSFKAFAGVGVKPFLVGGAGALVVAGVGLFGAAALAAATRASRKIRGNESEKK